MQLLDDDGDVTRWYDYDPFGIELVANGGDTNPYRFCGEYLDLESGYVYLRARYYDPEIGRFISQDAVKDGYNWYVYCGNNPILYIDPSGHSAALLFPLPLIYFVLPKYFKNFISAITQKPTKPTLQPSPSPTPTPSTSPLPTPTQNPYNINDIWDSVTIEKIQSLHPDIQESAIGFILDAQSQGINLRITSGYRSFQEQDKLYAQGRTTSGSIITNARGGESYHNYGLAFDVVEIKNGQALWENDWEEIANIGKKYGFDWGGDWKKFVDKPHFENAFDYSLSQLQEMYNDGKTNNGYVIVK